LRWPEAEALVKQGAQSLVSFGDCFAKPEVALGFHSQAPERFV
jgi:hypothetical protein